ncbi:MAG: hypothetical protein DDT21_02752 [Syntrophomonadaceae bacterium]|nr:hypothetical protein [Bacillota bacterium]
MVPVPSIVTAAIAKVPTAKVPSLIAVVLVVTVALIAPLPTVVTLTGRVKTKEAATRGLRRVSVKVTEESPGATVGCVTVTPAPVKSGVE